MKNQQCPYCSALLPKVPTRKTKCPSCKKTIYLKYGPGEDKNAKRLMTEQQAIEIDKAWGVNYQENDAKNTALNCGVDLANVF